MIDEAAARERLEELLEAESTLVLATAGPAAAPLFYLPAPGPTLYWLSSPDSHHSRHLGGEVAVAVFAPTFHWEQIRGAQMQGVAEAVDDPAERQRIVTLYRARFTLGEAFDPVIARSVLYRFRPRRARYLDNALGFPGRVEIAFGSFEE